MKTKRFLSLLLALVMSLSLVAPAFASEPDDGDGEIVIEPRFNYLVVDSPITSSTLAWQQPAGYRYYRVWVHNTSRYTMHVTLVYPDGTQAPPVDIAPGGQPVAFKSSTAEAGVYMLDFDASGAPSGTVRVRIGNTVLPDD